MPKHIVDKKAYAKAVIRNHLAKSTARAFRKGAGLTKPVITRQAHRAGKALSGYVAKQGAKALGQLMSGSGKVTIHGGRELVGRAVKHDRGYMTDKTSRGHEKGQMCISHTEYIGDLIVPNNSTASTFTQLSIGINPANSVCFPWLSAIGISFQEFRFKRLVFEYRPLASEAVSNSGGSVIGLGSVVMAVQYNSDACYNSTTAYPNKQTMVESDYSTSHKCSEHGMIIVECSPSYSPLGVLYTSANTSLTQGQGTGDVRMQNLGAFQIAACGVPNSSGSSINIGEIYVHYEVELYKPLLQEPLGGVLSAHYRLGTSVSVTNALGSYTASAGGLTAVAGSTLALTFGTSGSNMSFIFPQGINVGSYLCVINWTSQSAWTAGAAVTPTITPTGAGTVLSAWASGATVNNQAIYAPAGGTDNTSQQTLCFIVQITQANSQSVTVTLGAPAANFAGTVIGDLFITQYNYYITA